MYTSTSIILIIHLGVPLNLSIVCVFVYFVFLCIYIFVYLCIWASRLIWINRPPWPPPHPLPHGLSQVCASKCPAFSSFDFRPLRNMAWNTQIHTRPWLSQALKEDEKPFSNVVRSFEALHWIIWDIGSFEKYQLARDTYEPQLDSSAC